MGTYPVLRRFTPEEYLQLERASISKNEYVDGLIYAMAGGTMEHARIVKNVDRALERQLEGGTCETGSADFKIAISDSGPYFYPDLSVICGEPELLAGGRDGAKNPVVVVEVLSKSTRKYDRDTKAVLYKEIPSIRHILLISQYSLAVEHQVRGRSGRWNAETFTGRASTVKLSAIGAELTLSAIYNKLLLPLKV